MLIDSVSQHQTEKKQLFVSTIDLNNPYNQLQLHKDTAKHCNFYMIFRKPTVICRFKTSFYGLTDMPENSGFPESHKFYVYRSQKYIVSLKTL